MCPIHYLFSLSVSLSLSSLSPSLSLSLSLSLSRLSLSLSLSDARLLVLATVATDGETLDCRGVGASASASAAYSNKTALDWLGLSRSVLDRRAGLPGTPRAHSHFFHMTNFNIFRTYLIMQQNQLQQRHSQIEKLHTKNACRELKQTVDCFSPQDSALTPDHFLCTALDFV